LQRVADLLACSAVLLLQFHCLGEKTDAHQRRLAPLPGEAAYREAQFHVVSDERLNDLAAHPLPTGADRSVPALIEAVRTVDITVGTRWLNKKCKRLHENSGGPPTAACYAVSLSFKYPATYLWMTLDISV